MELHIIGQGQSKKGVAYTIRHPKHDDVKLVWEYINKLSKERTYIRFQGEEISLKDEEKWIKERLKAISNNKSVLLFLIVNDKVHGICGIDLSDKTESHVAHLGLSIDQSIRGQGLGEKLITISIEEARKTLQGLKIISLQVKAPNETAINLYKKMGFIEYGHLPEGTSHKDMLIDEKFMYKRI